MTWRMLRCVNIYSNVIWIYDMSNGIIKGEVVCLLHSEPCIDTLHLTFVCRKKRLSVMLLSGEKTQWLKREEEEQMEIWRGGREGGGGMDGGGWGVDDRFSYFKSGPADRSPDQTTGFSGLCLSPQPGRDFLFLYNSSEITCSRPVLLSTPSSSLLPLLCFCFHHLSLSWCPFLRRVCVNMVSISSQPSEDQQPTWKHI